MLVINNHRNPKFLPTVTIHQLNKVPDEKWNQGYFDESTSVDTFFKNIGWFSPKMIYYNNFENLIKRYADLIFIQAIQMIARATDIKVSAALSS